MFALILAVLLVVFLSSFGVFKNDDKESAGARFLGTLSIILLILLGFWIGKTL